MAGGRAGPGSGSSARCPAPGAPGGGVCRALGEVLVFDPFELAPAVVSQTWSPLHGARTWDGALEVAWRLAAAGEVDRRGVEGGDFWAVAAEQRLAPLLYTAAATGAGME